MFFPLRTYVPEPVSLRGQDDLRTLFLLLPGALLPAPDGFPVPDALLPDVPRLPDGPQRWDGFPAQLSLRGQDGLRTVSPLLSNVLLLPGALPVPDVSPAVPDVPPAPDVSPAVPGAQDAVPGGFPGSGCCFWNSADG